MTLPTPEESYLSFCKDYYGEMNPEIEPPVEEHELILIQHDRSLVLKRFEECYARVLLVCEGDYKKAFLALRQECINIEKELRGAP